MVTRTSPTPRHVPGPREDVLDRGRGDLLMQIYDRLFQAYGPQHWWPGNGGFEMVVGAILTQSAAWPNVGRALASLKAAGALSPAAMLSMDEAALANLIRPSGYFNAKARKLRAFCLMLDEHFGASLARLLALPQERLRTRLLATFGIGPETADDIILYAAVQPTFVVDAFTRRIFTRLQIIPSGTGYEDWRSMFMSSFPRDATLYGEYHALIVRHAKVACGPEARCSECVLRTLCPTGSGASRGVGETRREQWPV